MRKYKNWAHKISSWENLTIWGPTLSVSPSAQRASLLLSTLISFHGMLKLSSCRGTWFSPCRGRCKCPLLLFIYSSASSSLQHHGLQHSSLPCSSLFPRACSNSWVSDAIQPSHPLLPLSLLPSIFPSIRVFSNELALYIRWPNYWSFSFIISPSNEHPGLIFRINWLDLLAVQGTLKSLLQHHSSNASVIQPSAFFTIHLSYPYMITRKTIALTTQSLLAKWCLCFEIRCLGLS